MVVPAVRAEDVEPGLTTHLAAGQIDIDQKLTDEDFLELCTRLKLDRVPVTVTKSKSGGDTNPTITA